VYKLSKRSKTNLAGVHSKLVSVVELAIQLTSVDFGISEGLRSEERQQYLFDTGKSKTMKSRHLDGRAVDVYAYVDGKANWDRVYYERIALALYIAADKLNYKITWGGSWDNFHDLVHFQIES